MSHEEKHKEMSASLAQIITMDLHNIKQECQPSQCNIWC